MNDEGEENSGKEQLDASKPRYTHPANAAAAMSALADSVKKAGGVGESDVQIKLPNPAFAMGQASEALIVA